MLKQSRMTGTVKQKCANERCQVALKKECRWVGGESPDAFLSRVTVEEVDGSVEERGTYLIAGFIVQREGREI